MIESSVVGAVVGAIARLAPEAMRYLDRHLERRHELAMQRVALGFESIRPAGAKYAEFALSGQETVATLDALKESWRAQFSTGRPWLDAVSVLVRPGVTYALVLLYVGTFVFAGRRYDEADLALLSGILSYWFLSRAIEKKK